MSDQTEASRGLFRALPHDVEGFRELAALALDLRASWNHASEQVWRALDPVLWDLTHNPWAVLRTASRDHIEKLLADPEFRGRVDEIERAKREALDKPAWFQEAHPQPQLKHIAYFSMEFMLSEALPIYSGGLGNVAGDQLKAASDLGVPVTGVSLLYSQGYFRQVIDANGGQQAMYPFNDPGQLPIVPLRGPNGDWLRLQLNLPGHSIWLRAWQVQVGRVKLYLLDSNDVANYPAYRGITSELYGGGSYLRLMQELVLGIGGWRLLVALGIEPEVCHLNEGHAAFAVLERARSFMAVSGLPFHAALAATCAGNLFTTPHRGGRRFRPFPTGSHRGSARRLCPHVPRYLERRAVGVRPAESPRPDREFQYGVPRDPGQRRRERRQPAPRGGESQLVPVAVSPLADGGSAGWLCDQWSAYPDMGRGGRERAVDEGMRSGALAG